MSKIPKRFLESNKVIVIYLFGNEIGYYHRDGRSIKYSDSNGDELQEEILNKILISDNFFDPKTNSIITYDARDNFDLFLTKVSSQLIEYGFNYKVIDGKFNREMAYVCEFEDSDGYITGELVRSCFYDREKREFHYIDTRGHVLKVVKILKNSRTNFVFMDGEGRKITLMFLDFEKFEKYKDIFFSNPPELRTTEDVQGWISTLLIY